MTAGTAAAARAAAVPAPGRGGPLAASYVLVLAVAGPLLARAAEPVARRLGGKLVAGARDAAGPRKGHSPPG